MLDAAADAVVARGWAGLRLAAVAARAGVSRQTVYNVFGGKDGLARALTDRTATEFLDGLERALRSEVDIGRQLAAAVGDALHRAAETPLLKAFLVHENSDQFLPLLTSDGESIVGGARDRIAAGLADLHPRLDRRRVDVAAESVTRLILSHIVLPLHPPDVVADQIAEIGVAVATPSRRST